MNECKHEFEMFQVLGYKTPSNTSIKVSICRHCGELEERYKLSCEIAGHIKSNARTLEAVNIFANKFCKYFKTMPSTMCSNPYEDCEMRDACLMLKNELAKFRGGADGVSNT